jgi:hypothetical protein
MVSRFQTPEFSEAVQETARGIALDGDLIPEGAIPASELVAPPDAAAYRVDSRLRRASPDLAEALQQLLSNLEEFNAVFQGKKTLEVQAELSLTGESEELESAFLDWTRRYLEWRAASSRLNYIKNSDPWRLYHKCVKDFDSVLGRLIILEGSVNADVLNLSKSYVFSELAERVLGEPVRAYSTSRNDQFESPRFRDAAIATVEKWNRRLHSFEGLLRELEEALPPESHIGSREELWDQICRRGEDLATIRVICAARGSHEWPEVQMTPTLCGRFDWDVHHGRSIASILTSRSPGGTQGRQSSHALSIRRDGTLGHRESSLIGIDSHSSIAHLAANWFLLELMTEPILAVWNELDDQARAEIRTRGCEPEAELSLQAASLVIGIAESEWQTPPQDPVAVDASEAPAVEIDPTDPAITRKRKPPQLPRNLFLSKIEQILAEHFGCLCRQGKGSERVAVRGMRKCRFKCHGENPRISYFQLKNGLRQLGISNEQFEEACRSR